jgi:malate synthase
MFPEPTDRSTRLTMNPLTITAHTEHQDRVLTGPALDFLGRMAARFMPERDRLLAARKQRQAALDAGAMPGFLEDTRAIREGDWRVAEIPPEARDRRTEITGPVNRKMVINALNSGACVYMADFEDANTPTWGNLIEGQLNLRDAVNRTIEFDGGGGRLYRLEPETALLMVRPRGWHLPENHVLLDDRPIAGALFDFALFLFHNHAALAERGVHPYFYLPKIEDHLEARLWEEVIGWSEEQLGIARGTVKVTVLIETLPAAFQMDEILYALRDRIQGLNCGRWDYIFSYIKCLRSKPEYLLPDRAQVTMDKGFLRAYSLLLIKTCHRRGAMAMGGMAAQIPIKGDEAANAEALARVRADKHREATSGHDGTWVAHPGLVAIALEEFDRAMPTPNQMHVLREDVTVGAADLLRPVGGSVTEAGLRGNIRVGLLYLAAWLGGNGCVPIDNLMEDAATAEIARAQLWQWIRHPQARLDDGREISADLYLALRDEIVAGLSAGLDAERLALLGEAAALMDRLTLDDQFADFLTLDAYEIIG